MQKRFYKATFEEMSADSGADVLRSLRSFILIRFSVTLFFIYIADNLTTLINERWLIPIFNDILQIDQLSIHGSDLGFMTGLTIFALLNIISSILPNPFGSWLRSMVPTALGIGINLPEPFAAAGQLGSLTYFSLAFLFIICLLLIALTPYIIGALWFRRQIVSKMNLLLQIDRERRKKNEEQRNLMLSDIAHDIKTPITSVCGYAHALSDHLVPEDKKEEYLTTIYSKSMRISDLINMLFEYVKMDSTGFTLMRSDTDINQLVLENTALAYSDLENANLQLEIEVPEVAYQSFIDKTQISRVITNLLSNAVKYLPSGSTVLVKTEKINNEIFITVADNGDPIEEELADHIFEPFSRGDKTRSTKGGSGLGLSIASKITALHGGILMLDNEYPAPYHKAFILSLPETEPTNNVEK